jgi:acyl dehydratase
MSALRERAIAGLDVGETFTVARTFTRRDSEAFGDLSRDYNPVHYDDRFARRKGLDGLICHGLLTGSMVCEIGGQIGLLASDMHFSFRRPVYFGDTITCEMRLSEIDKRGRARFEARLTNQAGQLVVTAEVTGRLPSPGDRDVLAQMVSEGDPTNPLG